MNPLKTSIPSELHRIRRIALISPPWPIFNRPSVQTGALKSYVRKIFPGLDVDTHHLYLHVAAVVGYPLYRMVSKHAWLGEAVFGALLFPDRMDRIEAMFVRAAKKAGLSKKLCFNDLVQFASDASEKYLEAVEWGRYDLVGISVCLCQFTSSLYFAKKIKENSPELPIVMGGSMVAGPTGSDLLNICPDVDFIIQGEGELPLTHLIHLMDSGKSLDDWPDVPGLLADAERFPDGVAEFGQLDDLTDLPPPDYDDYFHLLNRFPPELRFFPVLPAEMSRGCWWSGNKKKGCAFCNLNRQWTGYRHKAPGQVAREFEYLINRYKSLKIAYMDNLLPAKDSDGYLDGLIKENREPDLFGEIRAGTSYKTLAKMKAAGFRDVQIGVEALSTTLLRKMNKGTTAIQNLQVMKNCEELELLDNANLIINFPGSDAKDVEETLRVIEFARPFRPLAPAEFWLGPGGPVSENFKEFGLSAVFNHPNYKVIFPPELESSIRYCVQGYRGGVKEQRDLWKPVRKELNAWRKEYGRLHERPHSRPILSYRDGGDFLVISRKVWDGDPENHRLLGKSREVYLYCSKIRSLNAVLGRFPELSEKEITGFFKMMIEKKLVFEEAGNYLSLAVRVR